MYLLDTNGVSGSRKLAASRADANVAAWMESIGEDMYLCCLARLRGLQVRVTASGGYAHRQGATFGGNRVDAGKLRTTYRRRYLSERNKTSVMLACTPGWLLWPLLGMHVIALFLEGAVLAAWRRDARIWREIYAPVLASVAGSKSGWKTRRREVQAQRRTTLRAWLHGFTWVPRKLSLLWRHGMPTIR